MSEDNEKLGIVISKPNPNFKEFSFQISNINETNVGDFVVIKSVIKKKDTQILGIINQITSQSPYYSDPRVVEQYGKEGFSISDIYPITITYIGTVDIVRVLIDSSFELPFIPPAPGDAVFKASKDIISCYLGIENEGLNIGNLSNFKISIKFNYNKLLNNHIAVIGTTGSGKSYTNGVIVEEVLKKEIPIVIIDPHGEYHSFLALNNTKSNLITTPQAQTLKVKTYSKTKRINFTFNPYEFNPEMFSELLKLSETQEDLLTLALIERTRIKQNHRQIKLIEVDQDDEAQSFDLDEFISLIQRAGEKYGFMAKTVMTLIRKIKKFSLQGLFGKEIDISNIVEKNSLSIVDVSDTYDEVIQRIFAGTIMMKIFEARKKNLIPPLVLIVEESHIFAPQNLETGSKWILRKIAREGRKFGICLILTSQRIIGLDKDCLSQCNIKLTLKTDSRSDIDYIKPYLGYSTNEYLQLLPILPVGTAIISGTIVNSPVLVKIRGRKTKHGGFSPKFVN